MRSDIFDRPLDKPQIEPVFARLTVSGDHHIEFHGIERAQSADAGDHKTQLTLGSEAVFTKNAVLSEFFIDNSGDANNLADSMTEFTLKRLTAIRNIEREHFWFKARRRVIRQLMRDYLNVTPNTILEVGCGTGFNLDIWRAFGANIFGMDSLAAYLKGKSNVLAGDVHVLPIVSGCADVVVALDVLEHVDDTEALNEICRALKRDGFLFLTVPAMPWLWSYRDDAAGHKRRYTRATLEKLVTDHGFSIKRVSYFIWALFPLVIFSRLMSRKDAAPRDREDFPGKTMNNVLTLVSRIDAFCIRVGLELPWGSSLVLVAQKKQ